MFTYLSYRRYIAVMLSFCIAALLFVSKESLAQNAPLGCDKYTLLISEFVGTNTTTMAIPFPNTVGQMPANGCDLGNQSGGEGIAIDPDKNIGYIAVPNNTGIIKVYNYATGTFNADISIPGEDLLDVIISADKQYLYVTTYNGLYQISTATNAVVNTLALPGQNLWGTSEQVSTGRIYFDTNWNNTGTSLIQFTDASLSAPTTAFTAPADFSFRGINFASDGTLWAVAANNIGGNDRLYQFNVNADGTLTILKEYDFPANTNPFDLAFGPDGKIYIVTFDGPCVYQVDVNTGNFVTYISNVPDSKGKGIAFVCGNFKCPCANDLAIGTATTTSGNCASGVAANNGTATIDGIGVGTSPSSSMKVDINEGTSYGSTPIFGDASNKTVSGGSVTFTGLKPT